MCVVPLGRPPKNSTRPRGAAISIACSWAHVAGAGDDHDVGAEAVGRVPHGAMPSASDTSTYDMRSSPRTRSASVEPVAPWLEQQHLPGALEPGQRGVRGADGAGADHGHGVVEADGDVLVAADRVRERVGEGRAVVGQAVRNAEEVLQRDLRGSPRARRTRPVVEAHELAARHRCSWPPGTGGSARTTASRCSGRRRRPNAGRRPRSRRGRSPAARR